MYGGLFIMPYCTKCGNEIDSNTKFCPNCGASVMQQLPTENPAQQAEFSQAAYVAQNGGQEQSSKPKKPIYKRVWFWIIIVVLIIGVSSQLDKGRDANANANIQATATAENQQSATVKPYTGSEPSYTSGAAVPVSTPDTAANQMTTGEKNALSKALSYLNYTSFSYDGLVEQLEFEGFTHDESVFGADNCGADWTVQAVMKAISYLEYTSFSYSGLVDQLEFEGFTHDQAVYGVDSCGADWMEQAVKKAASYLQYSSFSRSSLISQLEFEGFTHDQAVYGVEQNGF